MTGIFHEKLVFAAAAFFCLAPCLFSVQNDKELSIVRKDMEDSVIYEMILKTKDEQCSIWDRKIEKVNGLSPSEGLYLFAYDIKGNSLFALLAQGESIIEILQSDDLSSNVANQKYAFGKLEAPKDDDLKFGIKSYRMSESGLIEHRKWSGCIEVEAPRKIIFYQGYDKRNSKKINEGGFCNGVFFDGLNNPITSFGKSNGHFTIKLDEILVGDGNDLSDFTKAQKLKPAPFSLPTSPAKKMSVPWFYILGISGVVLLAGGVFATRRWRNK